MLCSNCGGVVRPIVALDLDGTLAEYHAHLHEFAAQWFGVPNPDDSVRQWDVYDGSEPYWKWFTKAFKCDRTTFRQVKLAFRQGGLKRNMPIYNGARELVLDLRASAEVWLTTTRPWDRFDRVDPDTREWLRRNGVDFDGLLYDEDKYRVLAEQIDSDRVVAVLDDLGEQYDAAARAFGATVPVLRRTHYNRAVDRPLIANTLAEAGSIISGRIAEWELHHG